MDRQKLIDFQFRLEPHSFVANYNKPSHRYNHRYVEARNRVVWLNGWPGFYLATHTEFQARYTTKNVVFEARKNLDSTLLEGIDNADEVGEKLQFQQDPHQPIFIIQQDGNLAPSPLNVKLDVNPGLIDRPDQPVNDPGLRHPINMPEEIESYTWSMRSLDNQSVDLEVRLARDEVPGHRMLEHRFPVSEDGLYEFRLLIRFNDGQTLSGKRRMRIKDYLIVSIGDSYASGEGNPDILGRPRGIDVGIRFWDVVTLGGSWLLRVSKETIEWGWQRLKQNAVTVASARDWTIDMDPKPVWLEEKAHRSILSGPAQAAVRFGDMRKGRSVTFLSFARSGSTISNGLIGGRVKDGEPNDDWIGNIGQIEEMESAVRNREIDALIISIGGNDVGFSSGLKGMVEGDSYFLFGAIPVGFGDDAGERDRLAGETLLKLDLFLPERFRALKARLSDLNIKDIFVTGYPEGLFDRRDENGSRVDAGGCEIFYSQLADLDITRADARKIRSLGQALNNKLQQIVDELNQDLAEAPNGPTWHFVGGIAEEFEGRGYCCVEGPADGGRCGDGLFVTASKSLVIQGDTRGTMHPNEEGHKIYADRIHKALLEHVLERQRPIPLHGGGVLGGGVG